MKGRKPPRKGGLSGDDEALWHHVTRAIAPARIKPRVPGVAAPEDTASRHVRDAHAARHHDPVVAPDKPHRLEPKPARVRPAPALADFDVRTARRIARGRIEIDARLDLHGKLQSEAHAALRSFLHAAQARGLKVVLVITGKGARPEDHGRSAGGAFHGHEPRDRGVLRRNVPHWLAEPELRQIVVSFTPASVRHGGDGALYVYLRSRLRV